MQEDMHFRMAASALQTTVSGLRNELRGGSSQSREALSYIPPNCGHAFFYYSYTSNTAERRAAEPMCVAKRREIDRDIQSQLAPQQVSFRSEEFGVHLRGQF